MYFNAFQQFSAIHLAWALREFHKERAQRKQPRKQVDLTQAQENPARQLIRRLKIQRGSVG